MKNEFIPRRLYKSIYTDTIIKCISDNGENSYNFTGVVVSSSEYLIGDKSNQWNKKAFELVKSVEEPEIVKSVQEPEINVIL